MQKQIHQVCIVARYAKVLNSCTKLKRNFSLLPVLMQNEKGLNEGQPLPTIMHAQTNSCEACKYY